MPEINPYMSAFPNAKSNKPTGSVTLNNAIAAIQDGTYAQQIATLRAATTKDVEDGLKKHLPGYTWSGTFAPIRNLQSLDQYSFVICQDIDDLDDTKIGYIKSLAQSDSYVLACFISPRGKGVKLLFQTNTPPDQHGALWQATANYIKKEYEAEADEKCKDVCRLCFVSHDPELYFEPNSTAITADFIKKWTKPDPAQVRKAIGAGTPTVPAAPTAPEDVDIAVVIQKCHDITAKTVQAAPGSYNKYINVFCLQANRYGIPQEKALASLLHYCSDHDDKDTRAVVANVYKNMAADFRKWDIATAKPRTTPRPAPAPMAVAVPLFAEQPAQPVVEYDDTEVFWFEVEKLNTAGKRVGVEYKYSYNRSIEFLQNNGFAKYSIDNKYQFAYINHRHKTIEIIDELRIKEFLLGYLKTRRDEAEVWQVMEMVRRGIKNYCSVSVLEGLEYQNPPLKKDTKDTAFVYFKNCFLEVTRSGIVTRGYSEQNGYVWKKQVKEFHYTHTEETSEFERYIWYAVTGRKAMYDEYSDAEKKKIDSTRTSIGYLLHRFKNPAMARAVIAVDKKKRSLGEPNGRSGKSLLAKGISKMITECMLDGPNFKFEYDFAWQKVNIDTQFINFNDVPKNFAFERLFGMITEEFTFNKKKIEGITIPFADAPKFYISTNFSLKGEGESNRGRQQLIEFSDFFTSTRTPAIEFGHMFFSDWDDAEWCRFYNFMVGCIGVFLDRGLLEFPLENYALNKLIDTCGEELIDYLNDIIIEGNPMGTRLELREMFEKYIAHNRHHEKVKQNTFSKWLKQWADVRGLLINVHKADGRDRSNGKDYMTFTKPRGIDDEDTEAEAETPMQPADYYAAQPDPNKELPF